MPDLVCVILSRAMSAPLSRAGAQQPGRRDVLEGQPPAGGHLLRTDQLAQRVDRRMDDVDRVVRAERLRQHVVDTRALEHGAHRAAGDDAGTGAGRLEQHDARCLLALHRVRDRRGDAGDAEEVLLRLLDTLGDRGRHLLGLAVADADGAVTVTDDDERGEAEPAAALDDLGDAVDRHHAFEVRALLHVAVATAVAAVTALAAVVAAPTLLVATRTGASLRSG